MGRRKIEFKLDYFEDGVIKSELLNINFVSNRCRREYNDIINGAVDVQKCFDEMNYKFADIAALKTEKENGYKQKIKELQKEIVFLNSRIAEYGETQLLERRFEIIKKILQQNEIEDEKFMNFEFWDENVDPTDTLDFLNQCVFKDSDTKKKQ